MTEPNTDRDAELLNEIEHFLQAQRVLVLATSHGNVPMAHAMHYVPKGLTVYLSSLPGTQKLTNIGANPTVGFAVWRLPSFEHRDTMRSLQVRGEARLVTDPVEISEVHAGLNERYPWAPELSLDFNATIAIEARELLWLDGSKGLDGRFIVELAADR